MNSGVNDLAKSSYLGFKDWIMGEERKLRMSLFKKLADGHGLNEYFSVLDYERGNSLNHKR
jgi:hypothetical protein